MLLIEPFTLISHIQIQLFLPRFRICDEEENFVYVLENSTIIFFEKDTDNE